jgi:hypothetical protein
LEKGRDPRHADVVSLMKNSLAKKREEVSKKLLFLQKGKDSLAKILDRFQCADEGENYLDGVARGHLAQCEQAMRVAESERDQIEAALTLLKRFKFRLDARSVADPWSTIMAIEAFTR